MSLRPRVLVVDDEVENLEFMRRVLRRDCELSLADNPHSALELVRQHEYAVIVSDLKMPGLSGVEFLAKVAEIAPNTVRVILTAFADADTAIDAINLSRVSGFVRKPVRPTEIQRTVASALELYNLQTENTHLLRQLEARNRELEDKERLLRMDLDDKTKEILEVNRRLAELVVRDSLTGLYNHGYFQERTEQEVDRARRYGLTLSLAFFDLDGFKSYNDLNGHPQGDEALVKTADILSNGSRTPDVVARVRCSDVIARYGGEEFVILLPETPTKGASIMADRLRVAIAEADYPGQEKLPSGNLTVSVGIATYPCDAEDRATLIERADAALYRAKATGRNRVCVWGPAQE